MSTMTMELELDLDRLRAHQILGKGATGTVFLVSDISSPNSSPFALKVVPKKKSTAASSAAAVSRARSEISTLSTLHHPFLPTLLGHVETPDLLAYALPFCEGGDLSSLRLSLPDHVFSPSSLLFYSSELVLALHHLHHRLHLLYRDLKPENLLLSASGHLCLSDFDLSRPLHPPISSTTSTSSSRRGGRSSSRVAAVADGERSNSFVGTEEYVAPEIVRGQPYDFAVDWWALGVLIYEMAFGATPFRGRNRGETYRNILFKKVEFVGKQGKELKDLIGRLLDKDPSRRLGSNGGAEEVRAHAFFRGVKWDMLEDVARPPHLPPPWEEAGGGAAASGFDVREYFRKKTEEEASDVLGESPAMSSDSLLAEF